MPAVGKTSDMAGMSARRDASGPAGLSSPSSGGRAADRRWRWTSSDIAVGAALGVACGLVFWLFNFAYAWLSPIIGGILPGLASIRHPLWYFSGTLAVIILRKPGAAVYVNLVGSAAEMLLGNQFSFGFVFASAALQGVFAELPFALTRYRVFNLPINTFEPGAPADFFLFDPELEWQVTPETLYSKSHNTPWLGKSLKGRVSAHWIGGVKIV